MIGRLFSLLLLLLAGYLGFRCAKEGETPEKASVERRIEIEKNPNVIVALRRLARLETAEFAIERVVDARDKQSHLWGLIRAEDTLLLVASGVVAAGIDFEELKEGSIRADWDARQVDVRLPAPRVLRAHLDEERTYVHSRRTDTLAERRETLETDARRAAERELEQAALASGILDKAQENARATVESLLYSLGFQKVTVTFEGAATGHDERPKSP
jgi:hypothetical protein